jgi:hypothetical protein
MPIPDHRIYSVRVLSYVNDRVASEDVREAKALGEEEARRQVASRQMATLRVEYPDAKSREVVVLSVTAGPIAN